MITHYLKVVVRNLLKYKTQTFISILGLVMGLTCFIFCFHRLSYETSYDNFYPNNDTYLLKSFCMEGYVEPCEQYLQLRYIPLK